MTGHAVHVHETAFSRCPWVRVHGASGSGPHPRVPRADHGSPPMTARRSERTSTTATVSLPRARRRGFSPQLISCADRLRGVGSPVTPRMCSTLVEQVVDNATAAYGGAGEQA